MPPATDMAGRPRSTGSTTRNDRRGRQWDSWGMERSVAAIPRQLAGQLRPPPGTAGPALRLLLLFGKGPSSSLAIGIGLVVVSRRCCQQELV